ncbi:uncharacterized protein LOC123808160 [Phyllostomus hastatus]|uniref:uncharacterized protein LOC123808160 n=1 Tax=Phyllostomus hastatus TaxID=9423 RepID=UPI001E681579|nr:uncharacterized protein LOC123808160 [Phyllostomus hastatus]
MSANIWKEETISRKNTFYADASLSSTLWLEATELAKLPRPRHGPHSAPCGVSQEQPQGRYVRDAPSPARRMRMRTRGTPPSERSRPAFRPPTSVSCACFLSNGAVCVRGQETNVVPMGQCRWRSGARSRPHGLGSEVSSTVTTGVTGLAPGSAGPSGEEAPRLLPHLHACSPRGFLEDCCLLKDAQPQVSPLHPSAGSLWVGPEAD